MQRILRGTPATLTFSYQDSDGASANPSGTVTVAVTREDGTEVLPAGTATTASNNLRTVALTAAQTARLDVLTATWTNNTGTFSQTTTHEVVGGFYVTLDEIGDLRNISGNSDKFAREQRIAARTWFEDLADRHIRSTAMVPRYQRDRLVGDSTSTAYLSKLYPRDLIAVSIDGAALDSADWVDWTIHDEGRLVRNSDVFTAPTSETTERNVTIAYEYGLDAPPEDLRQAALVAIRSRLITDRHGVPSRELSVSNELGIVRISQPGPDRPTGIPEVDEVLNAYRDLYRVPALA